MTHTGPSRSPDDFIRAPLPRRFCNLDRLLHAMHSRGIDGIVASLPYNVFYLTGFNPIAHKSDEPRPYTLVLSREAPDHPILIVADYYLANLLAQPTWVEDIRPFRAVMMPFDLPPKPTDIDRFIPRHGAGVSWVERCRKNYTFDMETAVRDALRELGLMHGRIAFDDMGVGLRLNIEGMEVADGCDPLMFARAVKTETEIGLLERATRLNELAIGRTVTSWKKGVTWRDLNKAYASAVIDLGGFVRDPGGMVWGHPCGSDAAIMLQTGLEADEVMPGTHVMFDCHGTLDLYCWDGGKTWVVDDEPQGAAKLLAKATAAVAADLLEVMRPGARISELQARARSVYRKAGAPAAEAAIVFFHGLGLSHMDIERTTADGRTNADWTLEEDMVVPLHLLYPGGANERWWIEEVVHVTRDGGRPLFSWGFDPLSGA